MEAHRLLDSGRDGLLGIISGASLRPMTGLRTDSRVDLSPDWSAVSAEFGQYYDIYQINKMLCLAPGQTLNIFGHEGSPVWEYLEFRIERCVNVTGQANCATTSAINSFMASHVAANDYFKVEFIVDDKIVTPQNSNPIMNVIEKDFFLTFTPTSGSRGSVQLGTYKINTDDSVFPFSYVTTTTGHFFESHESHAIQLHSTHYISFQLGMSSTLMTVNRNHGKIDQMLSYVGGLFGLLVTFAAFMIGSYSEYSYEMAIADHAF